MFLRLLFIILIIFANSCSKKEEKISIIQEKEINLQMIDAYKEGVEAFEKGEETSDSSDSESGEGFTNDGLSLNPFGNNENSDDLFLENILSMATDCQ